MKSNNYIPHKTLSQEMYKYDHDLIFGVAKRVKAQKVTKNDNFDISSVTPHTSRTIHYMIVICGTLV